MYRARRTYEAGPTCFTSFFLFPIHAPTLVICRAILPKQEKPAEEKPRRRVKKTPPGAKAKASPKADPKKRSPPENTESNKEEPKKGKGPGKKIRANWALVFVWLGEACWNEKGNSLSSNLHHGTW